VPDQLNWFVRVGRLELVDLVREPTSDVQQDGRYVAAQ
jgi:hypothetical protein